MVGKRRAFKILGLAAAAACFLGDSPGGPSTGTVPGEETPARTAAIVQGVDLASAVGAVESVGGEITHRLGVIRAVSARLTAAERRRLAATEGVIRVWDDRAVRVATGAALRDRLDSGSYDGDDGTVPWSGPWQELGEADGPGAGRVRLAAGTRCAAGGCLEIGGHKVSLNGRGLWRAADLSGAATATLSFTYRRDGGNGSHGQGRGRGNQQEGTVSLQASADGGATWVTVALYRLPGIDPQPVTQSFDITAQAGSDTVIRFLGAGASVRGSIYFDDVEIELGDQGGAINVAAVDQFNTVSYEGDDSGQIWDGPWEEEDLADWGPALGAVQVASAPECAGGNCLRIGWMNADLEGKGVRRKLNLGCAQAATLSYSYRRVMNGANPVALVAVEVKKGLDVMFSRLATYELSDSDDGLVAQTFDVSSFMSPDTEIRFVGGGPAADGFVYIDDVQVETTGGASGCEGDTGDDDKPFSDFPELIGADRLHDEGITGAGVTVAVVDTGFYTSDALKKNSASQVRLLASYDAIQDTMAGTATNDDNGHGAHVGGILLNSEQGSSKIKFNGVAPDADLVMVKAFDASGAGTYSDVIRGMDWILLNKDYYGIRVVNLSLSAPVQSYYWDDPLNQAVMAAWQAGIVVVASAGNTGPEPMTIGVPGNVPYVVTVGAMTDNYTPAAGDDDFLASWSAAGPTVEAFVKPEVVAPGGHMVSKMPQDSATAQQHPEFQVHGDYYAMSGTSQAAAVVSGVVALMLDADPSLSNDDVKCRLMYEARPAVDPQNQLAYSIFQQGAGLIDVYAAVYSTMTGCANQGLDVAADVAGTTHFHGPADQDADGNYYLTNRAGDASYEWDGTLFPGGYPHIDDFAWSGGYPFIDGSPFVGGYPFIDGYPHIDAFGWTSSFPWTVDYTPPSTAGISGTAGINAWVAQR